MAEPAPPGNQLQLKGLDTLALLRQLGLLLGIAASVAIGVWVVLWAQQPNFTILFPKLDQQEAGVVMDALQQLNVPFKLDESTGALLVASKQVQEARIKLAAQGLPKGGTSGFGGAEKGDFFVSDNAEKARANQALQLELAQSISSLANVKHARVHIAVPTRRLFVRDSQKTRAAVVVSLFPGRSLDGGQVAAIAHMVASSVPELSVDDVTVVDQRGKLLTNGESSQEMALTSTQFDYARKVEQNYVQRIENILIPILGPDSIRAQVTADLDFTFNEQTQESFNPDTPIARSVETLEEIATGAASGGTPGAVSNQPPGETQAPEQAAKKDSTGKTEGPSRNSKRETRNYELDKTVSVTRFAMGGLRRLSVAVVVDDLITRDATGAIIRAERSPEELQRITDLVRKAIGFNLQRGDTVNVINSPFTAPVEPEALPGPPVWEQAWVWDLAKQIGAGLLMLFILLRVLKTVKSLSKTLTPILQLPANAASGAFPKGQQGLTDDQLSLGSSDVKRLEANMTPYDRNMQTAIQAVSKDPKLVAQVVKNWVSENE